MVEALVALSVFALAGVGLVNLQTHSISTLRKVETHALAGMVAQNVLVQAIAVRTTPDLGAETGETELSGRTWTWRRQVDPTAESGVLRVTVSVRAADGDAPPVQVHGFRVQTTNE